MGKIAIKIAIIVDAYSTGSKLPAQFKEYGFQCVHIQSSTRITGEFTSSFQSGDFLEKFIVCAGTKLLVIAERIKTLGTITCVVAGTETGVEIADSLAKLLGLAGNDPATSRLRRDKYRMHEKLRSVGLSSLRQGRCETPEEAATWAVREKCWPLVVKPVASAGADDVTFCANRSEVIHAAEAILGKKNKIGEVNDAVVLQEKIRGQQYIVNAVSIDGLHYISEIWQDNKIPVAGASVVCDREILMASDAEWVQSVQDYAILCLNSLGITDGPSHTELFRTADGELILIETAARMQGSIDHEVLIEATGHSHVTLTALRYGDPASFLKLLGKPYRRRTNLHCVTLCAKRSGTVKRNRSVQRLGQLKSFRSLIHAPRTGDSIVRTVDLFTHAGIVYLANEDEDLLEREYELIRHWESTEELFDLH
jgi:hypothetical protein